MYELLFEAQKGRGRGGGTLDATKISIKFVCGFPMYVDNLIIIHLLRGNLFCVRSKPITNTET